MTDNERNFVSQLFLDHRSLMYSVARRFFGKDDVYLDDAIGCSIEKICRYCPSVMRIPAEKLKPYITAVVENVCKDIAREQSRFVALTVGDSRQPAWDFIPDLQDSFGYVYASSDIQNLRKAFGFLTDQEKELFISYFLRKVPVDTIADERNATTGAVKTALSRIKAHFLSAYREIREIS